MMEPHFHRWIVAPYLGSFAAVVALWWFASPGAALVAWLVFLVALLVRPSCDTVGPSDQHTPSLFLRHMAGVFPPGHGDHHLTFRSLTSKSTLK